MLPPTMYEWSMIELPTRFSEILSEPEFATEKDDRVGGINMGFVANK